jgi:L-ascorbate 6-phosphate lactonase
MTDKDKIVRTDGRGILAGDYLNENRDITREVWLEDSFPRMGHPAEPADRVLPGTGGRWGCGGWGGLPGF